jgi:orotidine-5'-phosphate decarboxylase
MLVVALDPPLGLDKNKHAVDIALETKEYSFSYKVELPLILELERCSRVHSSGCESGASW